MTDKNDTQPQQDIEKFVEQILTSKQVWALEYPDGGFAICPSNNFDEVDVYVVWGEQASAQACCSDEWKDLVPVSIDLEDFVESWLPGMYEDGLLVGPNWDSELAGPEIAALELAKKLSGTIH